MEREQQTPVRVLIVDDHAVVRQGLRTYLELYDQIEVVGEAADGQTAVAEVERLAPDVVLMDLVMPEMDGIEATRRIRAISPETKVIALTSFAEDDKVFPVIQAGASSYLLKDVAPQDLVDTIVATNQGESHLHPEVTKKLMTHVINHPAPAAETAPSSPELIEPLSDRELEILRLVVSGRTNREIADELFLAVGTIKKHVSNIMGKLSVSNRTEAVARAQALDIL